MPSYTFSDIDLAVQVFRRYALAKIPPPQSLQVDIEWMFQSDRRLSLYFHSRILRYPSIKRWLKPIHSVEAAEDSSPELAPTPPALKAESNVMPEMMFG